MKRIDWIWSSPWSDGYWLCRSCGWKSHATSTPAGHLEADDEEERHAAECPNKERDAYQAAMGAALGPME